MATSYVPLQDRKEEIAYNVDAVHKSIPDEKSDKLASSLSRKQLSNFKRFEIRKRADERKQQGPKVVPDSGYKEDREPRARKADSLNKIGDLVNGLIQAFASYPTYRSNSNIKSESVNLRDGPSVKFELNSDAIIKALANILNSNLVKVYTDELARKAAVVYRAMQDDIRQDEERRRG